ncbi:protein YIPF3-like [Daktulosphaira vitifoliae]|uniref:protein YIPF3-like n=1 Tax=Daktulosphaira vitifoliae TaxID=58002 RepID=UPI0021AA4D7B|nr:protein YIPF3-like [Daktulosphaira vitifoliae]XP_050548249.1 protein YIPF3-like [Daktulosphaira vitifoliae]
MVIKKSRIKDHSIVFLGSHPSKKKGGIKEIISHFIISPGDLLKRILHSFLPPFRSYYVHIDFMGPVLAFVILATTLSYGHAYKITSAVYHRSPSEILFFYCSLMPVLCYILTRLGQSKISFVQLISLLGYGLYGYVFTLIISFISDETNNILFFMAMIIFTGSSVLRVCLIVLVTIKIPVVRLLVCSIIAIVQVLFVVFLYFTFVHSSFKFVKIKK